MAREDYYAQQEMVQNSRALLDAFTVVQGTPNPEAYNLRPIEVKAEAEPVSPSSPPLSPSEPPAPAPVPASAPASALTSAESETDLLNSVMSTGLAPTTVNPPQSEEVTALTTSLSSVGVEGTSLEVWQGAINKLRPERSKALLERVEALQKGEYLLDTPFGYKTVLGELGLTSDPQALIETTGPAEVIGGAAGAGWRIGGKGLAALSAAAGVLEAPLLPYVDEVTEGNFLLGTALGILTGVGTGVAVEAGIPAFGRALSHRVDKYILDDADILGYDTLKVHKLQKYKLTKAIEAGDLSSPETRRIVSDVIEDVKKDPSVTLSKEESAALTVVENKLSEPNTKLTGDRPNDELVSESWNAASPEARKRSLQEEAIVRRAITAEWYGPPQYPKGSNRIKELNRLSKHIARENPSWSSLQIRAKATTLMNERVKSGYYSANWMSDYSAALRQAETNGVELTVQARKDIAESLTAEYNKGVQADIDRVLSDTKLFDCTSFKLSTSIS
jgi:polyhydroxyalkanoate synthesis regulator phasin